jgi:hypothetical protein
LVDLFLGVKPLEVGMFEIPACRSGFTLFRMQGEKEQIINIAAES